jgi:two-component system cell cycle response regulator DivK
VIEAASGQMALSRVREKAPDLVLLDIRMPGFLDGLRVSEVLNENPALQAVPIIAVSASPQETFRHQALAAGCSGFLSKPVNFKELREEIARLLPAGKRG